MTTWRVNVAQTCAGAGCCVGSAPEHFALGSDGRSHPLRSEVAPDDTLLDAAESCPVEAISIVDTETGEAVTSF
ncbi:ferredoxin [Micromonospora sp. FIMYZ51]|uniref:ferredoxin n=1 Tax=Micromonospora sp. FIMYZ51 TaxID=3051832 RepID=UPI00311F6B13